MSGRGIAPLVKAIRQVRIAQGDSKSRQRKGSKKTST